MLDPWNNFFVGVVGAAAALTGLLFVAVSINLARILQSTTLPSRAIGTLTSFMSTLLVALFGLVPMQSSRVLGCEIAGVGLGAWALFISVGLKQRTSNVRGVRRLAVLVGDQVSSLSYVAAGAFMAFGSSNAIYGLVPGVVSSFLVGVIGAWVLLVEIQR